MPMGRVPVRGVYGMDWRPRNRHGTRIDPVPFAIVSLLAALIVLSWGPPYLLALGIALEPAVGISAGVTAVLVGLSYYRYVWTANPEIRSERPVEERFRRLVYAVLIGVALLALLTIPLIR